jgi:hypothetical protein
LLAAETLRRTGILPLFPTNGLALELILLLLIALSAEIWPIGIGLCEEFGAELELRGPPCSDLRFPGKTRFVGFRNPLRVTRRLEIGVIKVIGS